jgi:O-antigen/teichoic acid export membrane protein
MHGARDLTVACGVQEIGMSVAGPPVGDARAFRRWFGELPRAVRGFLTDGGDGTVTKRVAGFAFLIRVASAGILYLVQLYLARQMGRFEFGIYVYVWTWVGFLAMLAPLGHANSAQRLIPEFLASGDRSRLRGFLVGSRWLCFGLGTASAAVVAAAVIVLGNRIPAYYWLPFMIGSLSVPIFTVGTMQDGIARAFDWIDLALIPAFILHPLIVLGAMIAMHLSGIAPSAQSVLLVAGSAMWVVVLLQMLVLDYRLKKVIEPGSRRFEPRAWLDTALPVFMIDGFYLLLTYVDVLVLQIFVGPADIAVYYTAIKTLALMNFVYFAITAASAHRFSRYHFAGERSKLEAFIAEMINWTFWPSLALAVALLIVGKPLLSLFGPGFASGFPLMVVLAGGLLARSAVGPAERVLSMIGEQRTCAAIYATAFVTNLLLCFLLIPRFGLMGAAVATATAIMVESTMLFVLTKRRLGLHFFVYRRRQATPSPDHASPRTAAPTRLESVHKTSG